MRKNDTPFPAIEPANDGVDFWRAVQNAPSAKALDGSMLVDLSFIYEGLTTSVWWPRRELLAGYVPPEVPGL